MGYKIVQPAKAQRTVSHWNKHVFLHIPKTAGTTLTGILNRNYPAAEIKQLYNPNQFEQELATGLADVNITILYGHFAYDASLNSSEYYVFTFLREPIARTISNYLHLKKSPEPQHKAWMKNVNSIEDFLQLKQAFNWQARHLSGQKFSTDFGKDLGLSFGMAKENLARMNFVGLTEQFEDSLLCLSTDLGWTKLKHKNQNVQLSQGVAEELATKYGEQIAEQNKLDMELYELATRLFQKKFSEITALNRILFNAKKLL